MSYIYLAENRKRSIMKLGISIDPMRRLQNLRNDAHQCLGYDPGSFRLILTMKGTYKKEQSLLARFNSIRTGNRREWLYYCVDVKNHLRGLGAIDIKTPYVPVKHGTTNAGRPPVITKCAYCKEAINGSAKFREHLPRCPKRKAA